MQLKHRLRTLTAGHMHVHSALILPRNTAQGKFSGGRILQVSPVAKFSLRVTNNFTASTNAGECCEFRYVRGVPGGGKGQICVCLQRGCVTGMH